MSAVARPVMPSLAGMLLERVSQLAGFAEVELMALPARHENPVFRIPVPLRLASNKSAIGTGIARGSLDAFG